MKLFYSFLSILLYLSLISCEKEDFIEELEVQGEIETIIVLPNISVDDSLVIKEHPEVEIEKFFSFKTKATTTNQGFAIFNNMMFQCYHTNNIIDIIDLSIKKVTSSIYLEPEELVHCNNVNFGADFFDPEDKYPLLYIQQRGYANKLNAYRIVMEEDSLSASLIQTISFSPCSYSVTSINSSNNILYVMYGYNKARYLSTFYVPNFKGENISIDMKNAIKTYILPSTKDIQDSAANDKYLYFLCGYGKEGEIWQIDMNTNEARVIDLPSFNLKGEPEGIDCYEDGLLVSFLGRAVYKIRIS